MNQGKIILLVDATINLFLGAVLLAYSEPVIHFFGLPDTTLNFYPNILGAVLFGIGIALIVEYKRKDEWIGLGLGGAISINLLGGIVLFFWLVAGNLDIPVRGRIILWILDVLLVGISSLEFILGLRKNFINRRKRS